MAYSELIKDFGRIRTYLRSFYVYGFRHRGEFTQKSARSYDNERRRVESWLGDYMKFGQDEDGKRVFLSVDSRSVPENPLYRAFRARSFTDRDITLHFHMLDILKTAGGLSITGMMDELSERLSEFDDDELPDESTVRKKLREYASLGFVVMEKRGRETFYRLSEDQTDLSTWDAAAAFFSEASPLGVIGSFVQERMPEKFRRFRFKHHYILNALDSEILYELFCAMGERRLVTFTARGQQTTVLPLKIYIGTQTGRQYLLAWSPESGRFSFYRADLMDSVKAGVKTMFPSDQEVCDGRKDDSREDKGFPSDLEERLSAFCAHVWGVTGNHAARLEHLEMTVLAGPEEGFIVERLEREKRCGTVEQLDDTHWRFSADVYEAFEMLPWLRTFTGRVTDLRCTDRRVLTRFWKDFEEAAKMYQEGGLKDLSGRDSFKPESEPQGVSDSMNRKQNHLHDSAAGSQGAQTSGRKSAGNVPNATKTNGCLGANASGRKSAESFPKATKTTSLPGAHATVLRLTEIITNATKTTSLTGSRVPGKKTGAALFHEIYGSYYRAAASIMREAVRGSLTGKRLHALVQEQAFGESLLTIPDGMKGGKWRLLHRDLSTSLEEEPSMPLTLLEKRWMKAMLMDPRIRLFEPDGAGLEDVEPLFTPDMVVYYDRYLDGDDYQDSVYIRHFRTILRALREKRNLYIRFETKHHAQPKLVVTPHFLEYSEKDDRFRLIAAGRKRRWVINLSRIRECGLSQRDERMELLEAAKKSVTFELEDRRNALDRVLLHFSHLEKETKRLDGRRYRVTLKYDRQDETEMVIRLLSFGAAVRVIEPESFVSLLRERIEKQKQLATFLPGSDGEAVLF